MREKRSTCVSVDQRKITETYKGPHNAVVRAAACGTGDRGSIPGGDLIPGRAKSKTRVKPFEDLKIGSRSTGFPLWRSGLKG